MRQWEESQLQLAIRSSLEENEEVLAEIRRSNDLIDRRLQRQGRQRLVAQGDGNCQFAEVSSWLSWYRGTLVSLTDCRWWFDSPLVRE